MPKPKTSLQIIIFLYALVPLFTPAFYTLDPNGPKFLALALLNICSYMFLLSRKDFRTDTGIRNEFFSRSFGLVYILFLVISLLSFFKALNIYESIIQFSRTFTVFSAVFILFLIFTTDKRYFRLFMYILACILFIDCLTVFYGIVLYAGGKITGISEIKSVYANKNILASAIFVKIPVALWLHLYGKDRWKRAGLVILLFAFLATLFLSTRAFYLGLILLTIFYISFCIIRYKNTRDTMYRRSVLQYIPAFIIAVTIFSAVQIFLYPKQNASYTENIVERLGSIKQNDVSTHLRLETWKNTLQLIMDNPLSGVGVGNWKIAELKMENQVNPGFSYMYKNHNDFLEVTAETGLLGGLAYLALFILPFILVMGKWRNVEGDDAGYLFLPAFGLLCYCVDAFFNFPADRPEMQGLFAVYLASAMCFYPFDKIRIPAGKWSGSFLTVLFVVLMASAVYPLFCNFISSQYQMMAREDIEGKKFAHDAAHMISGFPFMPDLDGAGAPISTIKAGYLLHEGKYQQVISLLKNDKSSPYDSRPQYFMAIAYEKTGDTAGELSSLQEVVKLKPFYFNGVRKLCSVYADRKDYDKVFLLLTAYLSVQKQDKDAWLYCSELWERSGNPDSALATMNTALLFLPGDTLLIRHKTSVYQRIQLKPYADRVKLGLKYSSDKDYANAIKCFTGLLEEDPRLTALHEYRGECYYFTQEYLKAVADLDIAIQANPYDGSLYNYRGACHHSLRQDDDACKDFETGKKLNDRNAANNYLKLCARPKGMFR